MPDRDGISDAERELFEHYCSACFSEHVRDDDRIVCTIQGTTATLCESRFDGVTGEWDELPLAQFRLNTGSGTWSLFLHRCDEWMECFDAGSPEDVRVLLGEVERDPDGVVWLL